MRGTLRRARPGLPRSPIVPRLLLAGALVLALTACSGGDGEDAAASTSAVSSEITTTTTSPSTTTPALVVPEPTGQYDGPTNWLCHPDLAPEVDECDDLDTTVVTADGTEEIVEIEPAADPPVDCFYVYPTVSTDPGAVADLDPGPEERSTTRAQFASYAAVCRPFAPVYRQITLNAIGGAPVSAEERELAYGDVLDAWHTYLRVHNDGRTVMIIGHSQGAGHLTRLLEEEIAPDDGQRALLLSAILLGSGVGPIDGVPECGTAEDTGCLVTFSSYPASRAPVEGNFFGRVRDTGEPALCVDPTDLVGDGLAEPIAPTRAGLLGAVPALERFTTPFVTLPDAFDVSCEEANGFRYLAVDRASSADVRPLDPFLVEGLGPDWGLHLFDANLVQGELVELVRRQAASTG